MVDINESSRSNSIVSFYHYKMILEIYMTMQWINFYI